MYKNSKLIETRMVVVYGLKIRLEIREVFDSEKYDKIFYVSSNYRNVYSLGFTIESAVEKCIVNIEYIINKKKKKLISEESGVQIAKEYYEKCVLSSDSKTKKYPKLLSKIYVDLISGKCSVLENEKFENADKL